MNMNEEGKKNNNYIIALAILFVLIVAIIIIAINLNVKRREKPIIYDITTEAPTETITTTTSEINKPIVVTNFSEPLKNIDTYGIFAGTDTKMIEYSGARFNYRCNNNIDGKCNNGSLTMNVGTTTLPIYIFSDINSNYGLRPSDIYISVNDENIIILYNDTTAKIKIYSRMGQYLNEINDAVVYYYISGRKNGPSYPSIGEKVTYHSCNNNVVFIKSVNISNINEVIRNIEINGANCN